MLNEVVCLMFWFRREEKLQKSISMNSLSVRKAVRTVNEVQEEISKASSKLVEYIKSQKVDRLTATVVNHFPSYDYRSKPRTVIGYTGSHKLSFKVPAYPARIILDDSVDNGATTVSSFSFRASCEVSSHARLYNIRYAVIRARIEAITAVLYSGKVLGNPVYVKIIDSYIPRTVSAPSIAESLTNIVLVQYLIPSSTRN